MRRKPALLAVAVTTALATAGLSLGSSGAAGASERTATVAKGGPGVWTTISEGGVESLSQATMARTSDGVVHVVYPRSSSGGGTMLSHASLSTDGSLVTQNDVLSDAWATMDVTPTIVNGASGMHAVFGGKLDLATGFYDSGRMFMADATTDTGESWNLPMQNVVISKKAYASYGTGAVELADGTVVADFALNNDLTWHVGTGSDPDGTLHSPKCCLYDTTMVRDGSNVYIGWYQNGESQTTQGTFVMQILPTQGTPMKAPGSSTTSAGTPVSIETGRVALAARAGGGVYAAYCVGYPTCTEVRLWKVGTSTTRDVPGSSSVKHMALSPAPAGRLWLAWSDDVPQVKALRTGKNGLALGAVRKVGIPTGHTSLYSLAIEGSRGRGDLVINVGDGLWHTQVLAGLTLRASPSKWRAGSRQRVVFTVTDAHDAVRRSQVTVGGRSCTSDAAGHCSITFPRSFGTGKHRASARKSGYSRGTTTLRVG